MLVSIRIIGSSTYLQDYAAVLSGPWWTVVPKALKYTRYMLELPIVKSVELKAIRTGSPIYSASIPQIPNNRSYWDDCFSN